jgi:hypothetical protein
MKNQGWLKLKIILKKNKNLEKLFFFFKKKKRKKKKNQGFSIFFLNFLKKSFLVFK